MKKGCFVFLKMNSLDGSLLLGVCVCAVHVRVCNLVVFCNLLASQYLA